MPENEFEKKVSSEMHDVRFKPSANVWLRVEERIKRKKNRRVFVIIFLLAGLALLGYWQRHNLFNGNKNDIAITEKQNDGNSKPSGETTSPTTVKPNTEQTSKERSQQPPVNTSNNKLQEEKSDVNRKNVTIPKKEINDEAANKDASNVRKPAAKKNKSDDNSRGTAVIVSPGSKKKNIIDDNSKVTDQPVANTHVDPVAKKDHAKQPEIKPLETKTDSVKAGVAEQEKKSGVKTDTVLKAEPTKESAKPIVKKESLENKWKWGFHVTPGISALNGNSFPISTQSSSNRFADMNSVSSGAGMPPVRQKPSDSKPGFALQAGTFVQRQLSSRTNLSLGLQYGYYSNIFHIGNQRSSSALFAADRNSNSIYNAGSDTIKYTNHYHFVELPLNFQWQLNKNKEKPFVWSIGFTIGQLIATNAIMYDTSFNGVYYQNKKLLNKTQFSLTTSFSWTIANNKRAQWSLGPAINIHLNRLVDNPFDNQGYLFFTGLRTAVLFNPKK